MTEESKFVTKKENRSSGILDYILMLAISYGVMYTINLDIDEIKKENTELRQTMSNLVQRVNHYHGTNWNYQGSGSTKTNDIGKGARSSR